jgi:hypothetical protein
LDAERLLEEFDIKKDSRLSENILRLYAEKESSSLLECLIHVSGWQTEDYGDGHTLALLSNRKDPHGCATKGSNPIDKRANKDDDGKRDKKDVEKDTKFTFNVNASAEERFLAIERELERNKAEQLRMAIQK